MDSPLSIFALLTLRVRLWLVISSFSTLLFAQNYCINVCSFMSSLGNMEIASNLFVIFWAHLLIREALFRGFKTPKSSLSLARHGYYLSIASWLIAGVAALVLHSVKYPDFPLGSHLKLLSSYWILGGGILAQLEYALFEKEYRRASLAFHYVGYHERIARRIVESSVVLTLAPVVTLLLILGRYQQEGAIEAHVVGEVGYVMALFVGAALISMGLFGRMLKSDTQAIVKTIGAIAHGEYRVRADVRRSDELGEISGAIESMAGAIDAGIQEIQSLGDEIMQTQKEVVYTMGEIAESRSKETGNHVKRVAAYSELLALRYGLDPEEAKLLRLASPMHDIGKVAIPDHILNKPGRHTPEEFEIMKTHALLGYAMLSHSNRPILKAAAIVAHEHHEKYDGSGYPRGLSGENIHIYGRITALVDVFDALGSDRVYKKAWEDEHILALIQEQSGKHFDPKLVTLFFASLDEIFEIREQYRDLF